MAMEIKCEKGEHIVLTDNCSQSFLGLVKSVNQDLGRIVLSDIIQLPDQKRITGYRNFDKNEIKEIKKYQANKTRDETAEETQELEEIKNLGSALSECRINELRKAASEFRYIKKFGPDFCSAIQFLKTFKKIGLLAKDISKGRCSRVSVIVFSTPSTILVFDLQALGDNVFNKGLKEILESSVIVKVVHDCRQLSDCLKHKHLINLEGVRDVEAEDIMVVFQQRKMIRKHSRPLEYLIKVYLGVSLESSNDLGDIWTERPLPSNQLKSLVLLASYLLPLQEAIEEKYLQMLIEASNIYNSYIRSLDFFEFLHDEPAKTLRKQIFKLVARQTPIRANRKEKNSASKENGGLI